MTNNLCERRVIIATPCLTGQVSVWYMDSIVNSIKLCNKHSIQLFPVTLANESILPMARNELLSIAFHSDVESMVFIDSDQWWDPEALLRIINCELDVVGLPVVDKTDNPGNFNVRLDKVLPMGSGSHLIEVKGLGTGFLKLSSVAIKKLHDNSDTVLFRGKRIKEVFKYSNIAEPSQNGLEFRGEDIGLCSTLMELGFKVWVDTSHTCSHVGTKVWHGDFKEFISGPLP